MAILTHGSDLTLAPTIEPIVRTTGGTVTAAAAKLHDLRFQAVQLDATLPGVRPRDLDQRARRDLVAALSRLSLRPAGLDLFIPQRHFSDPAHLDRAMAATLAAITLAADLGRLPLSLALPVQAITDDARKALVESADGHGVRLAVHAEDQFEALNQWIAQVDQPALGAGLDAGSVLARRADPVALVHQLAKRLVTARLSDWANEQRCAVGAGELDIAQYRVALDLSASARSGPIVLDVRGLANPTAAAVAAAKRWRDAAFTV